MNRKATSTESAASSVVRYAIYTRKSTEEGLEQEFNSLDAQRESAEAYIKSQQHEGWICLPDRYDEGGLTDGNMERPALRRLMAKFDKHQIAFVLDKPTTYLLSTPSLGHSHESQSTGKDCSSPDC
jgi:site-specific DNA recombinase